MKTKAWYQSSAPDSTDLALTIKGALLALVPFVIYAARQQGIDWTEGQVVLWIQQAIAAVSATTILYGAARKAYYRAVAWWQARQK